MYDPGKVLVMGGGGGGGGLPTASAEIIDLGAASPAWQWTGSMAYPRRQHNATLLADGKVLVTGGTSSGGFNNGTEAVFAAELWDPASGKWTALNPMQVKRLYHSSAVLLPDARVLSAGGGRPAGVAAGDNENAEIFSPPYLFNGPRPVLQSVPASVSYGQAFTVQTPDAASISQVTWVRLSAASHGINMNQRFNRLPFTVGTGAVTVTAPTSPNLAPPGHYMLFIINAAGVPSVAKIVQIL
jgi:hypothetical protein